MCIPFLYIVTHTHKHARTCARIQRLFVFGQELHHREIVVVVVVGVVVVELIYLTSLFVTPVTYDRR